MGVREKAPEGFELLTDRCFYTDDTVCTIAVYVGLRSGDFLKTFREICLDYRASYGVRFCNWLHSGDTGPYGSCGNGSAMRVSSVGWLYSTIETTREMARKSALITHNHPEGVKAAEAVASAIFLARNKNGKDAIREYVEREFGYDLGKPYGELLDESARRGHCELARETVPESIICFLESSGFEDAVRKAVRLHVDDDTMGAIAGGIAEAYYGIGESLRDKALEYLDETLGGYLADFWRSVRPNGPAKP